MAKAITNNGEIVEVDDDVMGIVSEIHDRWPDLTVRYLDPDRFPDLTDSPYIIVDSQGRKVMGVWELNRSVINQLALRDKSARELHQLVTREEEKAKKEREAAKREDREEAKDIMLHVFKSPKGTYSFKNDHDEKVVIDDSK